MYDKATGTETLILSLERREGERIIKESAVKEETDTGIQTLTY